MRCFFGLLFFILLACSTCSQKNYLDNQVLQTTVKSMAYLTLLSIFDTVAASAQTKTLPIYIDKYNPLVEEYKVIPSNHAESISIPIECKDRREYISKVYIKQKYIFPEEYKSDIRPIEVNSYRRKY